MDIFIANNILFTNDKSKYDNNNNTNSITGSNGVVEENEIKKQFSQSELDKIIKMKNDISIYNNLAKGIAPNVYGHDEV